MLKAENADLLRISLVPHIDKKMTRKKEGDKECQN